MEKFFYTSLCNYLILLNNGPGWAEICRRLITGNYGVIRETSVFVGFNPLNAELNPICHLLVLIGAHPILHISRIRVNICD